MSDCSIEVIEADRDQTIIVEDEAPVNEAAHADGDAADHDIVYAGDETEETEMFAADAAENGGKTEENNAESKDREEENGTEKDKSAETKSDGTLGNETCKVSALFELKDLNDILTMAPFAKSCTRLTISVCGDVGEDKLVRTSIYYETQHYKDDVKVLRELEAQGKMIENLRIRGEPSVPIQPRTQVIVKNVPEDITQEVLKMLFPTANRIILADDKNIKTKGNVMLLFDERDEAEKCLKEDTEIEIEGCILTLEMKRDVMLPMFVDRRKSPPKRHPHVGLPEHEHRRRSPQTSSAVARGRELAKKKARNNERERSPHRQRQMRRSPPHAGQIAYDLSKVENKERQMTRMKDKIMKNVISQLGHRFTPQTSTRHESRPKTRRQTTTDVYDDHATTTQNKFYVEQKKALLLDRQRQQYKQQQYQQQQQQQQQGRTINVREYSYKSTHTRATPLIPDRSMQSTWGRSVKSSHDRSMPSSHVRTSSSSHDRNIQSLYDRSLSSSHNRNIQTSHLRSVSSSYDRNTQATHDRRDLMSMNLKGMYQANASGHAEYLKQLEEQRLDYSY